MSEINTIEDNGSVITVYPWNLNNKLLTENDVYTIFEKAGFINARNLIKINDLSLYQTSFVHSSYVEKQNFDILIKNTDKTVEIAEKPDDAMPLFIDDYENMEFLGDRCLDLSIAFYLHRKYPEQDQGFKTKLKTKLVRKEQLAEFANYLNFSPHLIISKHVEEKTLLGRKNPRILEDVFEAFLCAIFLDQNINTNYLSDEIKGLGKLRLCGPGWQLVNSFIENIIENTVDFETLVTTEENYKELLLQYFQKEFKITPKYMELKIEGPPHKRIFTMGVLSKNGDIIGRGVAKSKKEAEQLSSKNALRYFGEISDEEISSDSEVDE